MTTIPSDTQGTDDSHPKAHLSNLMQRVITGVIVIPVVLVVSIAGGWIYSLFVAALAMIGVLEFYDMTRSRGAQPILPVGSLSAAGITAAFTWITLDMSSGWIVFAAVLIAHVGVCLLIGIQRGRLTAFSMIAGIVYVAIPAGLLILLRAQLNGLIWVLLAYALTWGTDTSAYFGGRLWGKTPLAPTISPKKTREGAAAGMIGGTTLALMLLIVTSTLNLPLFILTLIAPIGAILGDLLESALKRFFQIKDSHIKGFDIFPGHGGVLDRIDSLIVVTILCSIFVLMVQTGAAR